MSFADLPPGELPRGIVLGDTVALLPDVSEVFDRALWIQRCVFNPQAQLQSYQWISRGQPYAKLTIFVPTTGIRMIDFFAGKTVDVYLPSPVSGLFLHSRVDYGDGRDNIARTSVLLPDDEPAAEKGKYIFRHLCQVCWDYRAYIFFEPGEFKRSGCFTDETLKRDFDEQMSRACTLVPAMPRYAEYLDEARTNHSQLRPVLKHLLPAAAVAGSQAPNERAFASPNRAVWDVFISHASEDKDSFVTPLAACLRQRGLKVWLDSMTLTLGDSLRRSIDMGLASSRFGIVVLSESFFRKQWPQRELDGLVAREASGEKIILPIWHNITAEDIARYSPLLADRLAVSSAAGLEEVAAQVLKALGRV